MVNLNTTHHFSSFSGMETGVLRLVKVSPVSLAGSRGYQELPHICTRRHWASGSLLYHVHPSGSPGDFRHTPLQEQSKLSYGLKQTSHGLSVLAVLQLLPKVDVPQLLYSAS